MKRVTDDHRAEDRRKAAEMYVAGKKVVEIAKHFDVAPKTVYEWFKREEVTKHLLHRLALNTASLLGPANRWAQGAIDDPEVPASVKMSIWKTALEQSEKLAQFAEKGEGNGISSGHWKMSPWDWMRRGNGKAKETSDEQ